MSRQPRGGGRQQYQPRNEPDRHLMMRCRDIGLPFPPQPQQVCVYIQSLKSNAEYALRIDDFGAAASLYTTALLAWEVFPQLPQIADEHHKLLCNRSLVLLKMRRFKDAEQDALNAIASCPSFIKGYWRASQAVKGGYNGILKAMPYLVEGFRRAMNGEGTQHDVVTFLTEIFSLVPNAPATETMEELLNRDLVLPNGLLYDDMWSKVVQKLAAQNQWKSLAMLLVQWQDAVYWDLDDIESSTWALDDLNVANMLMRLSDNEIRDWGEDLAVSLIEHGASLDKIGQQFGMPTLHYVLKMSIRLDLQDLLICILDEYGLAPDKKNVQDNNGSTALHVLVQSPRINSKHGPVLLKLLLDAKCDTSKVDKNNKRPIDYVKQGDMVYKLLLTAERSVTDLRKELEDFKSQGNFALKAGKHTEALTFYKKALSISQQSKQLYKEAAILYSNQANVYFTLKNYTEALTNALAAISCDSAYHKGHWWKAKVLLTMGSSQDAFHAYMDGYIKAEVSSDIRFNFLMEAIILLKNIPNEHFNQCYSQLRFLDREIWPLVLGRLSKAVEWKCIAYLILGSNLDKQRFGRKVTHNDMKGICSGVAGTLRSVDDVQTNTIFQYIDKCDVTKDAPWLDAVFYAVTVLICRNMTMTDSSIYASIRFALKIGRTSLLETIPDGDREFENSFSDSVFHCITKLRPYPDADILSKTTKILLKKGYSAMKRDACGKLPVEYLDKKYPGYVFDMFFQATKSHTVQDINRLRVDGNDKFKKGEILEAVELYKKAIDIFKNSIAQVMPAKLTNHEVAVLYGNRAEGYIKLHMYKEALDDAMESNAFDGHWYKAHIRIGKALKGLKKMEAARKAFTNAFRDLDPDVEDKVKVEVLLELAPVCSEIPKRYLDVRKRLPDIPANQGHIWARVCYDLAKKGDWNSATVAYYQFTKDNPKKPHFTWSLKPFCDLTKLRDFSWGVEMILYFLECGCNRKTITLESGDTYLHAAVRMTLVVAKNMNLLQYLVKYCRSKDTEQHRVDGNRNTVLHIATKEQRVDRKRRYDVIILLLKCEVDPNQRNKNNQLAIDYLSSDETQSREVLRMAMYTKENSSKLSTVQQRNGESKQSQDQPLSGIDQLNSIPTTSQAKRTCDQCDDLYSQGVIKFSEGELCEGYEKMVELLKQTHTSGRHTKVVQKAVSEITKRLGETHIPEIPKCLTTIDRDIYLMIVDGLACSNKWRQLDMIIRKFRQTHGSDQLKGFASDMTVVPVVRETSLMAAEDLKLQIVTNILNSGGSLGTDDGRTAVRCAVAEEHYKVLTELVKRGADTTLLSMYEGDTPIHAALTIALEKEKSLVLLEVLIDQFEKSPETYPHLDPEQLDKNGDCLFHLIAKAKFSSYVMKLTEMLCKRNLCANYYNKDGKLPIDYITRKNDRRIQYLRLARTVKPSREQSYGPKRDKKENESADISIDDDLHQLSRPADREINLQPVIEVVKPVSVREKRKRYIEELIRLLPDSQHSIFNVEHSPRKRTMIENEDLNVDIDFQVTGGGKSDAKDTVKDSNSNSSGESFGALSEDKKVDIQPEKDSVYNVRMDDSQELSENKPTTKSVIKDVFGRLENVKETVGYVIKRTLEDVAANLNIKQELDAEGNRANIEDLEKDIGTSVDQQLVDSGPPSLEKDIESQTLNSSYSTVDESIDEYVDAQEPSEEQVSEINDGITRDSTKADEDQGPVSDIHKNVDVTEICSGVEDRKLENSLEEDHGRQNGEATTEHERIDIVKTDDIQNEVPEEAMEDDNEPLTDETGHHDRNDGMQAEIGVEDNDEQDEIESDDNEDVEEDDFEIDVQVFDNLEWEVECTAEVWKTLRDKHVLPELKRRIVRKIQLLACGDWQPHLCKKLKNVPQTLNLFEAKFTKGSRIIWELAIAFSPRCSETAERRLQLSSGDVTQPVRGGRIYSEIIRVWEIVLDHDKIHRCVQRIRKSHQRGETCIIQKKLRGMKGDLPQMPLGAGKRYPILYAEEEITEQELEEQHREMLRFFPPASSNDTEYHILKFYSFSSTLVSHVLQNIETKVDFPFRVTDLEHAIINLRSKAPILLLGRSGTGKTTCCLYRLWSQFHSYWYKAKEADAPLLPRCVEFIHHEIDESDTEDENVNSEDESQDMDSAEGANGSTCSAEASQSCSSEQEPKDTNGAQYDHIHQLFITKNAVLSNEVQKNFRELSHADELLHEHVEHEEEVLPNRLQDVQDFAFPLFLTSRQLLLMLDASIGSPYFFERKDDGALKVDIAGWTDLDGPLSFLPLLDEDSDAEEEIEQYAEVEEDEQVGGGGQGASDKKLKLDPRREITYGVFVEEVWPRVKKKIGSYHPSLVWMEIMSFIKGSYEALSKPHGYLTKDEYVKLGRKRAPNFSGERDSIYAFFLRYEHFKKQNSLFDETDLVHDTFRRLRQLDSRQWVIHQIFVDETQDFTQAELCMLIRLCQNPNDMFLTGDTAQSIMRGISFRFSDLRSLFYHAKKSMVAMGKTSAVEVPKKVYQLTHNYRSHAGILSLATSVLELMVEFFPESFDRLNPDQGLFHGPQPILLESCSFSDLAVLLRGNRRKTSHIEFGAHQAILVVNDAARESIPEELRLGLVLTIYEAKGLEFDDVLLYNFFKDSQAWKEWRVVTEFLERLAAQQKDRVAPQHDNLVQIDHEILSEIGRPRPLDFDPNQHKVLNSELKHLYTALTRARVNVWIFDEDLDKRAPMFEYFKVRKLVKCMQVEEINEASLSETVFAEKSSPLDWIRRGEDFMRHSLYGVAAKCFGMGGDHDKAKVALAHGQALQASRLKENPRQMREEFLYAAELYMECHKPPKAAICLQNAKERELAAGLFEKLGQYERAAEMYWKLKRPISSSRCYEQFGNYNKAVEALYESENFDLAIDTLKRYHMIIAELQQNSRPVPPQLLNFRPDACYTEEKLSHRAADLFHKYKNEEKMLDAVDRFQHINDKVEFLKSKKYIPQAAKILEEDGQFEKAARLLLMYGRFDEANTMAKKTLKEDVIAHCLLVTCRVLWSKKEKISLPIDFFNENLKEALMMFQSCNDSDQYGKVLLLQAEISGNVESIRFGWKAFQASRQFPNDAGLIECADWLVRSGNLTNFQALQSAVRGIDHLLTVCDVLLNPDTQTNRERVQKYDRFYGLDPLTRDKVVIYTKEKPLCMNMIQEIFKTKSEGKKKALEVQKTEVHETLVKYLLHRSRAWLKPLANALSLMRNERKVCEYFQAGFDCPNMGDVDKPCRHIHCVHTKESFRKLIDIDILMIEYEANICGVADSLTKKCPGSIKPLLEDYFFFEDVDPDIKYQTCLHLWNDIMPAEGHSLLIGSSDSRALLEYIRQDKVVQHFKRFLLEKWKMFTAGDKKLKSDAVRKTDVFLLFEFGYHLLGLDLGKKKMERSPIEEMRILESTIDKEVAAKPNILRNERYYTLMMSEDIYNLSVTCVAHRFSDAYELISTNRMDPFESLMKFSKFQIQLSMRRTTEYNFFPDMRTYIMWLEFYTCVAIFLVSKLKTETFPDFVFVLPSNYFALIQFIQSTFPSSGYSVHDSIGWWVPPYRKKAATENLIYDRLKGFAFVVSGHAQGVRILDRILEGCKEDPFTNGLLERLLILNMTMICNIGKSVAPETEISLMSSLAHIQLPEKSSERLQHTLLSVQSCKGIADVATVLSHLLLGRGQGEELMVCKWRFEKKAMVEMMKLKNVSLFETSFLNDKTFRAMHETHVDIEQTPVETQMEADIDQEEVEKGRKEKEEQMMKEKMNSKAIYVQRIFRAKLEVRRLRKEKLNKESKTPMDSLLEDIKVDDNMCGICGVFFLPKLEEKLEFEKSSFVGGSSVLNKKGPWEPQDIRQRSENVGQTSWESSQGSHEESPELKKLQLKEIRKQHMEEVGHVQKAMEMNIFRKKYREIIAPGLKEINSFLFNDAYGLMNQAYVAKNYAREQMAIERMKRKSKLVEMEIQLLLNSRMWSTTAGLVEQNMKELETDFKTVNPYVEETFTKLKQEENERKKQIKTSSSAVAQSGEHWEEELDEIEPVVEDRRRRKPMEFFNKMRYRRDRRK